MTPFGSLPFFLVLVIVLVPAAILGLLQKRLRIYGFAATLVFLPLIFDSWQALALVLGYWLWQAGLCTLYLQIRKKSEKRPVLWVFLLAALLPLILSKVSVFLPVLSLFSILGLSYMTFRALQVLIDIYDKRIQDLSFLDLSYFLLFFPCLSSGPVDRYRRFVQDLQTVPTTSEYAQLLRLGVWKLMTGALYYFVIAMVIFDLWLAKLPASGFGATVSYMYGYTFYMFFNFAGYSRMAVGAAHILGIRVPDNFNLPFLSRDMKEFWSRWHISLSTWLRDYVYNRFCMAALSKRWFENPRTASYLGNFLTMVTMGLWHGLTPAYLVYGAYQGLLMCGNDILDTRSKKFKKLKKQPVPGLLLTVLTFHLFAFGLLIFSGRLF